MEFQEQPKIIWKKPPLFYENNEWIYGEFSIENSSNYQTIKIKQINEDLLEKSNNFNPQYNLKSNTYNFITKPIIHLKDKKSSYYQIEKLIIYQDNKFISNSEVKILISNFNIYQIINDIEIKILGFNFVIFKFNYDIEVIKKILKFNLKIKLELIDKFNNIKRKILLSYNEIFKREYTINNLKHNNDYEINLYIIDGINDLEFFNTSFEFTTFSK